MYILINKLYSRQEHCFSQERKQQEVIITTTTDSRFLKMITNMAPLNTPVCLLLTQRAHTAGNNLQNEFSVKTAIHCPGSKEQEKLSNVKFVSIIATVSSERKKSCRLSQTEDASLQITTNSLIF